MVIRVHVVPGARRDEIVGLHGDRLKCKVRAPPEDGRANAALEALLATWLGVTRCQVIAGMTSRQKSILAHGCHQLPPIPGELPGRSG
jgi:uncharacterized protein